MKDEELREEVEQRLKRDTRDSIAGFLTCAVWVIGSCVAWGLTLELIEWLQS